MHHHNKFYGFQFKKSDQNYLKCWNSNIVSARAYYADEYIHVAENSSSHTFRYCPDSFVWDEMRGSSIISVENSIGTIYKGVRVIHKILNIFNCYSQQHGYIHPSSKPWFQTLLNELYNDFEFRFKDRINMKNSICFKHVYNFDPIFRFIAKKNIKFLFYSENHRYLSRRWRRHVHPSRFSID